jgi:hypothetical protein
MAGDLDPRCLPTVDRTWFTIDGSFEPIDFAGPSILRFPEQSRGICVIDSAPLLGGSVRRIDS